jgi:hypothetical protein
MQEFVESWSLWSVESVELAIRQSENRLFLPGDFG